MTLESVYELDYLKKDFSYICFDKYLCWWIKSDNFSFHFTFLLDVPLLQIYIFSMLNPHLFKAKPYDRFSHSSSSSL